MNRTHKTCKVCGLTKEVKDFRSEHGRIKTCLKCELQQMKDEIEAHVASGEDCESIFMDHQTGKWFRAELNPYTQKYYRVKKQS